MRSLFERSTLKPTTESITARSADVKTHFSQYEHLSITNEILCRRRLQPVVSHSAWQKIVPAQERNTFVRNMHKVLNGGHFGNRRSMSQVQQRYYCLDGPRTCVAPSNAVNSALDSEGLRCVARASFSRCSPARPDSASHIHQREQIYGHADRPLHQVGRDLASAQPRSENRREDLGRQGLLRPWDTDPELDRPGTNFESELFQEICRRLAVDKVRTTACKQQRMVTSNIIIPH